MIKLESYLFKLLLTNDCVSIPNFGGLVAQRFRSEINPATQLMRPPTKRISFHENLSDNNGLLVAAVAEAEKQNIAAARDAITEVVSQWHQILASGTSLQLDLIGRFYLDKQGAICFNQSLAANFDLEHFGLDIFRASTLQKVTTPRDLGTTTLAKEVAAQIRKPVPVWRAAAVFAGVGALLAMGYFKADVDLNATLSASFNPLHFSRSIIVPAEKVEAMPVITITQQPEKEIEKPVDTKPENTSIPDIINPLEAVEENAETIAPFQVIVGSFSDINNAQELVATLQNMNYEPVIVHDGGKYTKVSIKGFEQRSEAEGALMDYKSRVNKGAWIYEVK